MGDALAQKRIGQQSHAFAFDQDRRMPEEDDTIPDRACPAGHSWALPHRQDASNKMTPQADHGTAKRHGRRWLRLLGFAVRAATMLAVEALTLVVVTALLPGTMLCHCARRRSLRL